MSEICKKDLKTCCFIGHNQPYNKSVVYAVESQIYRMAERGVVDFLSGGMGEFDFIGAGVVAYWQKTGLPQIRNVLMIYDGFTRYDPAHYDEIRLDPRLEHCQPRYGIPKRNRIMVESSDCAICYVDHPSNGAYKTFLYAQELGIEIINLSEPFL